jgi:methylmalonyl-CoA mutase N-terminal domain/subunit
MKDNFDDLGRAFSDWESNTLNPALKKFPEEKEEFRTSSDLPAARLYTPLDLQDKSYVDSVGFPGQFPFTRGIQPTMYRGRTWTMRQYAGFGNAKETNERFRYLLDRGQTGLSVAFDLPTQMGFDADHPVAAGEVGRTGVSICTLADMEELFSGIPLGKVSTSMTINSTAAILLSMYVAVAEKQGVSAKDLNGTIQNDVLKEYIARGTYIYPPAASMRIITDIFAYAAHNVPKFNPISISGYHIREAGATADEEVGLTLVDAIAYVGAALSAGMKVDDFASRLSFFFCSHNNILEEVAKFRAARRLWARIMKDRFGAKKPQSMTLRFHTQTGGVTLTAQQAENNVVRVAYQALAAVLGGTQSLHTNSWDEALSLPSPKAALTALRTQQIVACESGVADSIDPLAGSYLVESWTDRIEERAEALLKRIDDAGGAVRAIEQKIPQRIIEESSYRYQKEIEAQARRIVGLNCYREDERPKYDIFKVSAETAATQASCIKKVKGGRDEAAVKKALSRLQDEARGEGNLMPPIIEAVKAYASVGEISDVLRGVFGTYKEA